MMKNRATCGFWSVTVVIAVLVMALGVTAVVLFSRGSLGEKMNLIVRQDGTPAPTALAPVVVVVTATAAPLQPAPTEPAAPAPTVSVVKAAAVQADGTCGNHGSLMLLFIGADFHGGNPPLGADAVRIVKVDYDLRKVTVVAFPRDLYLRTAGLANQNISATRLGLAYEYMKTATMGADKHRITAATTLVGQVLYDNFGVAPQNYLTLQMENVGDMVDAMGGVDIDVPAAFTSERQMVFAAGPQKLDGPRALEFVRTFQPGGDAARRQRQNLFVKALESTMLNAGIVTKIPQMYETFDKAIVTDLTPQMIADLACMSEAVPQEQVHFYEVSGDLVTEGYIAGDPASVLDPNLNAVRAKLVEWLGQD